MTSNYCTSILGDLLLNTCLPQVSIFVASGRARTNWLCRKQSTGKGELGGQKYDIRIPIVIGTIPRLQDRASVHLHLLSLSVSNIHSSSVHN